MELYYKGCLIDASLNKACDNTDWLSYSIIDLYEEEINSGYFFTDDEFNLNDFVKSQKEIVDEYLSNK